MPYNKILCFIYYYKDSISWNGKICFFMEFSLHCRLLRLKLIDYRILNINNRQKSTTAVIGVGMILKLGGLNHGEHVRSALY